LTTYIEGGTVGLFGRKKSGQVYLDAFENTYNRELAQRAGVNPSPGELAQAHCDSLQEAYESVLRAGVIMEKDYYDMMWLRASAARLGVDSQAAEKEVLALNAAPARDRTHENTPTRRKLVLTDDGRGVLIHGRDPRDPDSSWSYRPDAGIDFLMVEGLVQMEANHMDIDLGLPISWTLWQEDADEYARSPEQYKRKYQ